MVGKLQKLTSATIQKMLPAPHGKRVEVCDIYDGLRVRITDRGVKTWRWQKMIAGSYHKITIGDALEISPDKAREIAAQLFEKAIAGEDPAAEKKQIDAKEKTIGALLLDYIEKRQIKQRTIETYYGDLRYFAIDVERPIASYSRAEVLALHAAATKQSAARANGGARVFRLLWNYARATVRGPNDEALFGENPVDVLKDTRSWNRNKRKTSHISATDFPAFRRAVDSIQPASHNSMAFYAARALLVMLYTGIRVSECSGLAWSNVDLKARTFRAANTKNSDDLVMPMCDQVFAIFQQLHDRRVCRWVFPNEKSDRADPLSDFRHWFEAIETAGGPKVTAHDLRRTFATVAEALELSPITIKRLLNHKSGANSDVTTGYVIPVVERMRKAAQQIATEIDRLSLAE